MKSASEKIYDLNEAREKIRGFCAYRERSHREVREKLYSYGLIEDAVDLLLTELIHENFLNEERFARSFVRGKFRIKKWGRRKIIQALKFHEISDFVLRKSLEEIDDEKYQDTLTKILEKRIASKSGSLFQKKGDAARYAQSRGYESDLVWDLLNDKFPG